MDDRRHPLSKIIRSGTVANIAAEGRGIFARLKSDIAVWSDVRAFPPLATVAGLDCVAGLVLYRKLTGGPPLHLTNARLCLAGFAVAALTVAGRWWLSRIESQPPARWIRTLLMEASLLPMLALLSLANSQHSPWVVSFVSALAVASGGAVLFWNRLIAATPEPAPVPNSEPPPAAMTFPFPTMQSERPIVDVKTSTKSASRETPVKIRRSESDEWYERSTDESGKVTVQGKALARFAAGQSVTTVHLSFTPAFAAIPEFTCEVVDAPFVRSRTPAVYRYGARLELKRTGDTAPAVRVEIRFTGTGAAISSRAA